MTHALVHPSRRGLTWAGAGLFLLASWVWLGDVGITAPEPYTLPLAVGLVVVGLVRLRRDPRATTTGTLVPGLLLGTLPRWRGCSTTR
ncbi:hypothetical protein [Nocardioides sp. TF02-7]|uniref:SCO7613 C-terminal domain-containing membrane protein n=1 Tax=Nocardioides sp. TF02-7 TaxID=2917724 RepID=UPI001F057111|nr:hypothetical protein [Nocardioides sp. TF02-7]UMG91797.1 hypothetical protein MF408_17335 [Nocardioides sp. TF02-7]